MELKKLKDHGIPFFANFDAHGERYSVRGTIFSDSIVMAPTEAPVQCWDESRDERRPTECLPEVPLEAIIDGIEAAQEAFQRKLDETLGNLNLVGDALDFLKTQR